MVYEYGITVDVVVASDMAGGVARPAIPFAPCQSDDQPTSAELAAVSPAMTPNRTILARLVGAANPLAR